MAKKKIRKRKTSKKTKSVKKKPLKKRDKVKYPGLVKGLFSRIKQEYHDYDYVDKLDEKSKAFLSKFTEEYLGARLNGNGKLYHKTKKLKKDCFDRNNARNRDITSISQARGILDKNISLETEIERNQKINKDTVEDLLITVIDSKKNTSSKRR